MHLNKKSSKMISPNKRDYKNILFKLLFINYSIFIENEHKVWKYVSKIL